MLKNITLSAEEEYIEKARAVAASENRTLNQVFREWLEQYQARGNASEEYKKLMRNLSGIKSGKAKFSREDLNRR
jgi:uncharacterized protein with ParB-like and HNH nuclease domain